jgi:hypothetical protein
MFHFTPNKPLLSAPMGEMSNPADLVVSKLTTLLRLGMARDTSYLTFHWLRMLSAHRAVSRFVALPG